MYVTRIPNRDSPPAVLLRESYREDGKVKSRTLANISDWPEAKIESLRRVLAGETLVPLGAERFEIARALAHGHVAAALGTVRRLGLDKVLPKGPERRARLILAMIVARIVEPAAKLATARQLSEATAAHSLGAVLGLGEVDEDELYAALDLLGRSQASVEKVLAERHLKDGVLVLYDVTSSYLEGRRCELAQFGYSRDHRSDRPQIVFGLLCTPEGCPVAVEVFEGNLGDPSTLADQVRKLRTRFRLKRIVLVGDRGMITQARIDADLAPAGFDWITALRAPAIKALAAEGGPLQLSLFDERDMAEIVSDDYPGERLIVCRNPELAAERARKRAELLEATEKALVKIRAMTEKKRNPLRGADKIALKVGAVHRSSPHGQAFRPRHHRDRPRLVAQGRGDRRGSRPRRRLCDPKLASRGRLPRRRPRPRLQGPEPRRARLPRHQIGRPRRPSDPPSPGPSRPRPCLLVHAGLLRRLAHEARPRPDAVQGRRSRRRGRAALSPVAKAKVSPAARRKAINRRTEDGQPVHSFRTLLQDLANLTRNSVRFGDARPTTILSRPTPTQTRAFDLLGLKIAA